MFAMECIYINNKEIIINQRTIRYEDEEDVLFDKLKQRYVTKLPAASVTNSFRRGLFINAYMSLSPMYGRQKHWYVQMKGKNIVGSIINSMFFEQDSIGDIILPPSAIPPSEKQKSWGIHTRGME